jgi:hypothetical protein
MSSEKWTPASKRNPPLNRRSIRRWFERSARQGAHLNRSHLSGRELTTEVYLIGMALAANQMASNAGNGEVQNA